MFSWDSALIDGGFHLVIVYILPSWMGLVGRGVDGDMEREVYGRMLVYLRVSCCGKQRTFSSLSSWHAPSDMQVRRDTPLIMRSINIEQHQEWQHKRSASHCFKHVRTGCEGGMMTLLAHSSPSGSMLPSTLISIPHVPPRWSAD